MSYSRARNLLLLAGLVLLTLVVLTMVLRGLDPIEVAATLFFAPIFVGLLFFGAWGGLALGLAAAAAYVAMRWPAIRLVGFPALSSLVFSRILGFLVFGTAGGWAAARLRSTLDRLLLRDETDDETGLGNARSVINVIDRERSRAERHAKLFSVVTATLQGGELDRLPPRRLRAKLRDLGERLAGGIRSSDHAAHLSDDGTHTLVLVLPETGAAGAATVAAALADRIGELLPGTRISTDRATYPDDADGVALLLERVKALDAASRPPG